MAMNISKLSLLQEWEASTAPVEGKVPNLRRLGEAMVILLGEREADRPALPPDQIELASIAVPREHRGQKYMSKALKEVTRLADRFGVSVVLDAVSTSDDDDAPSDYELKQIYKSHGFYNAGGWSMRRDPAAP